MSILHKLRFNYWYFRKPPWDTNQTPPEVLEFIKHKPPRKVLDLGCGTGTNAITLAQNGWQVVGIDFANKAIRIAKRKAREAEVAIDFRVGDVTKLTGVKGPFDLILDIGCYHNLVPQGMADYRKHISRLLGDSGTYLLYVFFRSGESKSGPGVVEADLKAFSPSLKLVSRTEGLERNSRPSVWLAFQKGEIPA